MESWLRLQRFFTAISYLDWLSLGGFLSCWLGYTVYADRRSQVGYSLFRGTNYLREVWMERLLEREARIVDASLLAALMHSVSFFASTTMLIIGGLIAALGALDHTIRIAADLGVSNDGREVWTLKLLTLTVVFVYAFFKLTWALRQFNRCAIMIGAAPPPDQLDGISTVKRVWARRSWARRLGRLHVLAGDDFNQGLRAYYFALALLSWFVHPMLFLCTSLWVVVILYRREFNSEAVRLLFEEEDAPPPSYDHKNPPAASG